MVSAKSYSFRARRAHRRVIQQRMGHLSDSALVERFRQGEPEAIGVLVERHYPAMYALALRYGHSPDQARDAMQDSVVRVLLSIHQLRDDARFGPWMGRIVINSTRLIQRGCRRQIPLTPAILEMKQSCAPDPEAKTIARQHLGLVDQFLSLSQNGDHELFVARFLEGKTIAELSANSGLSESAVKVRIHRARKRLYTYFTIPSNCSPEEQASYAQDPSKLFGLSNGSFL